jgi:DNA-binding beta-propeller fold protein YncE
VDNGTPTGVTFREGNVIIPDTHNSRILAYTPDGELIDQWGRYGIEEDAFVYPTDIAFGPDGTFYIAEYGTDAERVHVFDDSHQFVRQWGKHGDAQGDFSRAMALVVHEDRVYVCDSANNRVQVFTFEGELLDVWGQAGRGWGQLEFPFDMALAPDGTLVLCDYGNNRVARFTREGECLGQFGRAGRDPGRFHGPRGVDVAPDGTVFVADTDNHRIQRFDLEVLG